MTSKRWFPHAVAAAITVPFAVWIAMSDIRGVLSPAAWLLPLAGAYYLGLRIGRELARSVSRHSVPEPTPRQRREFKPHPDQRIEPDPASEHGDR